MKMHDNIVEFPFPNDRVEFSCPGGRVIFYDYKVKTWNF
jgi:hypothetical protein